MDSQSVSCASRHRTDQWQSLVGEIVQIRLDGEFYREGLVDAAMPDASGLWVAAEGASQRKFIDSASGYEVWTGSIRAQEMSQPTGARKSDDLVSI